MTYETIIKSSDSSHELWVNMKKGKILLQIQKSCQVFLEKKLGYSKNSEEN